MPRTNRLRVGGPDADGAADEDCSLQVGLVALAHGAIGEVAEPGGDAIRRRTGGEVPLHRGAPRGDLPQQRRGDLDTGVVRSDLPIRGEIELIVSRQDDHTVLLRHHHRMTTAIECRQHPHVERCPEA